jgi:hypothetical protein
MDRWTEKLNSCLITAYMVGATGLEPVWWCYGSSQGVTSCFFSTQIASAFAARFSLFCQDVITMLSRSLLQSGIRLRSWDQILSLRGVTPSSTIDRR